MALHQSEMITGWLYDPFVHNACMRVMGVQTISLCTLQIYVSASFVAVSMPFAISTARLNEGLSSASSPFCIALILKSK